MSLEANLGPKLRAARKEQGLSVREMARRIGVSPSLVSQIETGKTQPSVGTLYALLTELDLSFDALVTDGPVAAQASVKSPTEPAPRPAPSPVVLQQDRTALHLEGGVIWERLNTLLPEVVDFLFTTYPPGACSSPTGKHMRHMGFEFGYVLVGSLTITIQDQRHVLNAGDAISFDSSVPHVLANEGSTVAHGLWCVLGRALLHSDLVGTAPNALAELFGARPEPYGDHAHAVESDGVPARTPPPAANRPGGIDSSANGSEVDRSKSSPNSTGVRRRPR